MRSTIFSSSLSSRRRRLSRREASASQLNGGRKAASTAVLEGTRWRPTLEMLEARSMLAAVYVPQQALGEEGYGLPLKLHVLVAIAAAVTAGIVMQAAHARRAP
jgi:hypothetical protein